MKKVELDKKGEVRRLFNYMFNSQLNLLSFSVRYYRKGNLLFELSKNSFMKQIFYGVTILYKGKNRLYHLTDMSKTFNLESKALEYMASLNDNNIDLTNIGYVRSKKLDKVF